VCKFKEIKNKALINITSDITSDAI